MAKAIRDKLPYPKDPRHHESFVMLGTPYSPGGLAEYMGARIANDRRRLS